MTVAVIGSGVGGLTAAILLAQAGEQVTVFEASAQFGGKIGYTEHDGLRCDTGPSVVTMRDVFEPLQLEDLTFIEPDPSTVYRWIDGTAVTISQSVEKTLENITESFDQSAADQFRKFLKYCEKIWENAAPAFVYAPAPNFRSLAKNPLQQLGRLRHIDSMRTMRDAIDAQISQPHLRDIAMRFATYNGSDPRRAPATLNCIAHVEITAGSYGIEGGYYELIDAMVARCKTLGVELEPQSRVTGLVIKQGAVSGVVVNEREFSCTGVVSNCDVSYLEKTLLQHPEPNITPSMSGWTALVRGTTELPDAHTVFFPERYLLEFEDIFDREIAPTEPTVYICNQGANHHNTFENGDTPFFVMVNMPSVTDPAQKTEMWETIVRQLEQHNVVLGDPFWTRSPQQLAMQFPGSRGSIYGASSNDRFAAFKRPANQHPKIGGLYIASGGAHPGGGVPMCVLSGRAAASALLDNLRGSG